MAIASNGMSSHPPLNIADANIFELQQAMDDGQLTSQRLVELYLQRIASYDQQGPQLNAVITLNPHALEQARQRDEERKNEGVRSPLHGIPVLLKDNINTVDMVTTAGSIALKGSRPKVDAFTVKKLREAGAIILGKVNLSEFATPAGRGAYSSIQGFTKNPHQLQRDASGSSGGSGVAAAANFATFALGTDTGGSIRGPAAANGVVGVRPTFGLISRAGVVPQSLSLDTVGPLTRHVYDAAIALNILAGSDPQDPSTQHGPKHPTDYTSTLTLDAVQGKKFAFVTNFSGGDPEVDALTQQALLELKQLGATIIEITFDDTFVKKIVHDYRAQLNAEFAPDLENYLATLGTHYPKTLAEVIAISKSSGKLNPDQPVNPNLIATHQQNLAIAGKHQPGYRQIVEVEMPMVRQTLLDILDKHSLDAFVWATRPCTEAPRFGVDDPSYVCNPDALNPSNIASYAGFPDVQVPSGMTQAGMPTSLSFVGKPFSEASLLGYAFAYEQATRHRQLPVNTPELPGETLSL